MPQVFLFANPLFYNLGLPGDCFLDLFLFVEVWCMIQPAIYFSKNRWFYNKTIKSHIFFNKK